jgi:hypothetical protein
MSDTHSRRTVLTALAAATTASVPALAVAGSIASHPYATLLRLGAEFDRLHMAWMPPIAKARRIKSAHMKECMKKIAEAQSIDVNSDLWYQMGLKQMGVTAAIDAGKRTADLIDAVTAKIRETPAKTFAGLAINREVPPEGSDKQELTFKSSKALPTGIFSRPAVLQRLKSNASFQ